MPGGESSHDSYLGGDPVLDRCHDTAPRCRQRVPAGRGASGKRGRIVRLVEPLVVREEQLGTSIRDPGGMAGFGEDSPP